MAAEITINGFKAHVLLDPCTQGGDLISNNFCTSFKLPLTQMEKKALETAMQRSRSPITNKTTVIINVQGYEEERTFDAANLRNWEAILGEPALKKLKAIMKIHDNMISIQPPGMARCNLIMPQKTGNDTIRSAAMWMQTTCETASESPAQPHSDAESDRTCDSESIKDYAYDETDYEETSDNESITDLDEQLRQLDEENKNLSRNLHQAIDKLEARMKDNNMIRRQQANIHPSLDYEFDVLMVNMEAERRKILGQVALYTIWEEEEEINSGSWDTWPDSKYKPGLDPVMYKGGDLICNHLTLQKGFDAYSEFPHLFPTEKPTELPPLREPMEIMQYKIEIIEGAEWHPNYIPSYDSFKDQITERVNKELEPGRIIPSKSLNTIIMFTQPKKDGKKARFLLNYIP